MTLSLRPAEDGLEYRNELHRDAGIIHTLGTLHLAARDVQDQVRTGEKGVNLDGMLALFDVLKLAQNIGVIAQTLAQCRLSALCLRKYNSSSLLQSRSDSIEGDGPIRLKCS